MQTLSVWKSLKFVFWERVNVTEKLEIVFIRIENIIGKEQILVGSIFSFSNNVFKSLLYIFCHVPVAGLHTGFESTGFLVQSLAQPISFQGLMTVTMTRFIPFSTLTIVSTISVRESNQWL